MTNQPFTEVELLKKQLAEETKEKYTLYKRVNELTENFKHVKIKIFLIGIKVQKCLPILDQMKYKGIGLS